MSDPAFDSRTVRLELPLLFAGQAQKETYVNEAWVRIDSLLHGAIEGEAASPPATPLDGQCWLVASSPSGDWTGHSGKIAARQAGNWIYFAPTDGMKLLNRSTGQEMRFAAGWKTATRPAAPSGGTTIDSEARTAISALLTALTTAGLIPPA